VLETKQSRQEPVGEKTHQLNMGAKKPRRGRNELRKMEIMCTRATPVPICHEEKDKQSRETPLKSTKRFGGAKHTEGGTKNAKKRETRAPR